MTFFSFSSGRYNVREAEASRGLQDGPRPKPDPATEAVQSTLQEVFRALETSTTKAGRLLRRDVQRHLDDAARGQCRRLPSLPQAREWLEAARFDTDIQPQAMTRLRADVAALDRLGDTLEVPGCTTLRRDLTKLLLEGRDLAEMPNTPAKRQRMAQLDAALPAMREQMLDYNAERYADINAAERCHRLKVARSEPRPPVPEGLFKEQRRSMPSSMN